MGDDAVRQFKRVAAARYAPLVQLSATQHCDAAVRTASKHRDVLSLLNQFLPANSRLPLRLLTPAQLKETSARSFARTLLDGARDVDGGLFAITHALKERLESLTTAYRHEWFALPLLNVVAVWVCEPQIAEAVSSTSMHDAPLVLLVTRPTAQDNAALQKVLQSLSSHPAPLLVLRLSDQNETQTSERDASERNATERDASELSAAAVAAQLDSRARAILNAQLSEAVAAADTARKAVRSSFRLWFSTSSSSTTFMPASDTNSAAHATMEPSSSGGDATRLASNSVAGAMRRLADLALMAGRYTDACDAYRMLAYEVRTFSSSAAVHHASALELGALSLALIDGSNAAIGAALESAVLRYVDANSPELAARAALRAVDFCLAAGYPDSAAGVLVRAIVALRPCVSDATPPLVDAVLALLCASCTHAYVLLKHARRASRFAFFAALRFAKLRYFAEAAAAAAEIDSSALQRPAIRHHVQYWMGEAALSGANPVSAVRHFSLVLTEAEASAQPSTVEVHASVVRAFLRALKIGAMEKLSARWDSGVPFPLLDTAFSYVLTHDMADCDREWHGLEDEVLEDAEFFAKLARGEENVKRERRVEALVSELRHAKRSGQNDPGGSLEMKIRRMRDLANARKRRRRAASLLERGAVLGEVVLLHIRLRNPLQFPVFVSSMSAVVLLDGRCYSLFEKSDEGGDADPPPVELLEAPAFTLAPNSEEIVVLQIVGRKAGILQFIGVSWKFTIGLNATFVPDFSTVLAPGFALLHRHGRRLNDTRRQRASDVPLYDEDESLTVTVAPLAPKLKATLLVPHFPLVSQDLHPTLTMRAGEVRRGHLELENEGSTALHSIVFRIGTPQTFYLGIEPEIQEKGEKKRVFSIGIKEQPVEQNEVVVAGRLTLPLAPGHKTRIPMWIRAAVSNALFTHRSSLSENIKLQRTSRRGEDRAENGPPLRDVKLAIAYGAGRLRISRVSLRFRVHPSVMVSPRFLREADLRSVSPDASNRIGCLFGVEVEHAGPSEMEGVDFDITKLTVTSKHGWKPMLLPAPVIPMAIKRGDLQPSLSTLRINETATFFVFLVRDRDVKDGCQVTDSRDGLLRPSHKWETYVADLNANSVMKKEVKGLDSEAQGALGEDMVKADGCRDEDRWERRAVTHFVVCSKHHSHLHRHKEPHERPDRVYVTVGWRTNEESEGDIQIPAIDPLRWMKETRSVPDAGNDGALIAQEEVRQANPNVMQDVVEGIGALHMNYCEKDPVQVRVCHPQRVEHDFFRRAGDDVLGLVGEQNAVIVYPAVVAVDVLVKNVSDGVLDVAFAAPTEGGVADGDRGRYWTGDVSMSLRSIAPGAERTICLTAVLIGPGRYNMCRFTMLYQTSSFVPNRRRQHIAVSPSYMTVEAIGEYKFGEDDVSEAQMEMASLRRISRRMSTGSTVTPTSQVGKRWSSVPRERGSSGAGTEDDVGPHAGTNDGSGARQLKHINCGTASGDGGEGGAVRASGRQGTQESRGKEGSAARAGGGAMSGARGEGRSAQLLSELKKDAFWNDADTDEEQ